MSEVLLQAIGIGKRFGPVTALNQVSVEVRAGTVHALLGENGAGKSTLVKCIMGYYQPDEGQLIYRQQQQQISSPQQAAALGIGMVYQHFTLIENLTIAENIILSRPCLPALIDWHTEIAALRARMSDMPFTFDLQRKVRSLSVGEKQKVEIVRQLLLDTQLLILDEPTSVLTPLEADEVLGKIQQLTRSGRLSVLMITHKFPEVMKYADDATVLRKGNFAGTTRVCDTSPQQLAQMMIGTAPVAQPPERGLAVRRESVLRIEALRARDDQGVEVINGLDLSVDGGEIVGIAGVSGNGQKQLVEILAGQRRPSHGQVLAHGEVYHATRAESRKHGLYCLPEEPLRNACVAGLSVADNLVLRRFDQPPFSRWRWLLNRRAIGANARKLIARYGIRTSGPGQRIGELSGGNVQRVVLARELAQAVSILVVANPCFGLDFNAVAEIHSQIIAARNSGAAVLLLSEDLDEVLKLSDRLCVISGGKLVHQTTPAQANLNTIGQYMAGH